MTARSEVNGRAITYTKERGWIYDDGGALVNPFVDHEYPPTLGRWYLFGLIPIRLGGEFYATNAQQRAAWTDGLRWPFRLFGCIRWRKDRRGGGEWR